MVPTSTTYHPPLEHLRKIATIVYDAKTDPRTVAILGAAYLEHYLTQVITSFLPGLNATLRKRLFEWPGTISELGAKIDIACALGAFGTTYRDRCITIARVRNRFAHQLDIDSFDHPEIVKLCDDLPKSEISSFDGVKKSEEMEGTLRDKFTGHVIEICAMLSNALHPEAKKPAAAAPSPSK